MGEQERRPAVLEHEPQPVGRVLGVEGHVRTTGLQDRQHGHEHLEAALDAEPDQHPGTDPHVPQLMGQPVGPRVERVVAERSLPEHRRRRLRPLRRPALDELVDGLHVGELRAGRVPLAEQLAALRIGEEGHLRERPGGVGGDASQQGPEMAENAPDGRLLEEVAAVPQSSEQVVPPVGERQGQVERRRPRVHRDGRGARAAQVEARSGIALQREHHLEQRMAAQVARRLQFLDEPLEGHVLVDMCVEDRLAHP